MNKLLVLFFSLSISFSFAQSGEQTEQIKAMNSYVEFSNESIHGMLIIHRMLENFNQEVNKYVDLQSNQLNFYGNKDLPKNIFEDPEHWFYPVSPILLYQEAKKNSSALTKADADRLNRHIDEMKEYFSLLNGLRFVLDDFISNNDLSQEANQTKIYMLLEKCVKLYDSFYQSKEELDRALAEIYAAKIQPKESKFNNSIHLMTELHRISKDILDGLHFGHEASLPDYNTQLDTAIKTARASGNANPKFLKALKSAEEIRTFTQKYLNQSPFSDKYKLYGRGYYYHNVEITSIFNRYGSGMVRAINDYINLTNATYLSLTEQPHYLVVIYPKKEIEIVQNTPVIENVPAKIKDREVVIRQQKIDVDDKKLLLEIYDHREEDGDIISLNFNGNWILKERRIAKKAMKVLVELNETGENYLILYAENLGNVPPNTVAIRYHYEGKRKLVVLNSDLNESELIQLNYVK